MCRKASGRCGPHRSKASEEKREETENAVGTFYLDYTYMIDCGRCLEEQELQEARNIYKTLSRPILVELDGRTEALFATELTRKVRDTDG